MITCCSCWYSVRIISGPCVDMQWPSDDYLLFLVIFSQDHRLTMCWYAVIIWWLPAVPANIQSGLSVDNVLIYSDYLIIICCSCWYSVRIVSWPRFDNMLTYIYYLMITCCSCWYAVRIISWSSGDIQWLSDDYLLFLLIFSQDHQWTMCWYAVIIWWLPAVPADIQSGSSVDHVLIYSDYLIFSQNHQLTMY